MEEASRHRHHCSHEHSNHYTRDENTDFGNLRKGGVGSTKNLPPKQKRTVTEKFPLELNALQRELEYYKQELERVEQLNPATNRTGSDESRLRIELQRANRQRTKLKKEQEAMSKEQEKLVKKLNELEGKVVKGSREIQSLRTVQDSKGGKKATSTSKPANPEATSKAALVPAQSMANLRGAANSPEAVLTQLRHENRMLQERLEMFQAAHRDTKSTFQPILRQNAAQIKHLIEQKSRLAKENAELKQKAESFQSSSQHFEQKYRAIEEGFRKLKIEYEKASKAVQGTTRVDPIVPDRELLRDKLRLAEQRLEQLQAANENNRNRIAHLESTNRYLVGENRRLSSNISSGQPSSLQQGY